MQASRTPGKGPGAGRVHDIGVLVHRAKRLAIEAAATGGRGLASSERFVQGEDGAWRMAWQHGVPPGSRPYVDMELFLEAPEVGPGCALLGFYLRRATPGAAAAAAVILADRGGGLSVQLHNCAGLDAGVREMRASFLFAPPHPNAV